MKIAIVGSGISGLVSAYLLSKKHEVTIFEAGPRLGGHTNTIEVKTDEGVKYVDTGFIVFNNKNYPIFSKLLEELGVEKQKTEMSFSVKDEASGWEYNGTSINTLFCQRRNFFRPKFLRMIRDIIRFNREATSYYLDQKEVVQNELISIEEFAKKRKYSTEFIERYLIPMGAALWSASRGEMRRFPFNFFVRFFHHHGMLTIDERPEWYVVKGGSKSYIPKIIAPFKEKILLNAKVEKVQRVDNGVLLKVNGKDQLFDHVVLACHADQALAMIDQPTAEEKEILGAFSYRPNDVLLHHDVSVLPKKKLGWASWNYFTPKQERERVAVSYNMNILQSLKASKTFVVSLNMDDLIDSKKVFEKIAYSHPVFDLKASDYQKRWKEISGKNKLHFAGAYWGNGFHEDGARSGYLVAETLGAV